jgi:dephospho-CoA kinase
MKTVGLTGGIGSGKSIVASIFSKLNVPVFSADVAGRSVLDQDVAVRSEVSKLFGAEVYKSGSANRAFIAEIVFSDSEKLEKLNAIIHPAVKRSFELWRAEQLDSGASYCIRESAILFESKTHGDCDDIIVVLADQEIRVRRTMQRDGSSRDSVMSRIENQWTDQERLVESTYQIKNDGESAVIPQVMEIHQSLLDSVLK